MTSVKMATSMAQTNLSLLRQHLSVAVGNSSVVVKAVAVAVTCGYFLTFAQSVIPYVAVTPGYVIPPNFWFWTFLTHAFIEVHFWDVLVDIAVVILCGKLLEPLWGALDMLLFFLIVNTGVAVVTAFSYLAFYLVSKNEEFLFETYIHGLAGYIAGFAVAVKQVMPDHVLVTSPFGKLRNTHIPLLLLFVVVTLRLAGLLDGPYPFMFGYGILISWIYLRFYQKHTNGNRGDMADNFGFPSFFPSQLQPFVAMFSNTVFLALVKVKICKKPQRKYDVSSPSTITITLPGTDQDAERRRQVALKALNERMNKSEQPASWPSLVDDDGKASPENSASPAKESLVKPMAKVPDTQEQQEQKQTTQSSTNGTES